VDVNGLVARFGVAAPTIRRDLGWLAAQGLARRVRGGAIAAGDLPPTLPLDIPARIGLAAAHLVQDGETIFLGPGPLTTLATRALADRQRLTVVTNSLEVAGEIVVQPTHTLILTGGQLERSRGGLVGRLAHAALEGLRADRVLLEFGGVCAVEGLTDDDLSQAELARALLALGAQVVALVAPQRVGRAAAAYIAPAADADVVVTAREADSASLWDLAEVGVRIVLA